MSNIILKALPPAEAVAYFRAKGYQLSFDWRDMATEDHAYAFTVAKAMRRDILQDIRAAMDKALSEGTTLATFKQGLKPVLQTKGWWGKKEMLDPLTGEMRQVQLGSPRRLRTIFDTNLRTSYAAGRWEQVQRTKKTHPYLRYVCVLDKATRRDHRQWHNVVKHVDDPFWNDHYPPNGWGCRCTVQQLSEADIEKLGLRITTENITAPAKAWKNPRSGQVVKVPGGIAPGFALNCGHRRMAALTPPPLDQPLVRPYSGEMIKVLMPPIREMPKTMILPSNLNDEEYVSAFLKEFGGQIGRPVIFKDVTGEPLIISDDLFKTANGAWKSGKRGRGQYMKLLAMTLKDPDEIFWNWQDYPKGRMTLTRHYLRRWPQDIEGGFHPVGGFTLFDTSAAGWNGVTIFPTDRKNYLENQRIGTLVYRRPDSQK